MTGSAHLRRLGRQRRHRALPDHRLRRRRRRLAAHGDQHRQRGRRRDHPDRRAQPGQRQRSIRDTTRSPTSTSRTSSARPSRSRTSSCSPQPTTGGTPLSRSARPRPAATAPGTSPPAGCLDGIYTITGTAIDQFGKTTTGSRPATPVPSCPTPTRGSGHRHGRPEDHERLLQPAQRRGRLHDPGRAVGDLNVATLLDSANYTLTKVHGARIPASTS